LLLLFPLFVYDNILPKQVHLHILDGAQKFFDFVDCSWKNHTKPVALKGAESSTRSKIVEISQKAIDKEVNRVK